MQSPKLVYNTQKKIIKLLKFRIKNFYFKNKCIINKLNNLPASSLCSNYINVNLHCLKMTENNANHKEILLPHI